MTAPDLLDQQLTDAFARASDSAYWATTSWPDPVGRVRRAAVRARVRRLSVGGVAVVAVVAGTLVGVHALPGAQDRVTYQPASGGSSGDATGQSGERWLLGPAEYEQYAAAHPSPSAAPDTGPSPAPVDGELTRLQSDVAAALPAQVQVVRVDAADGGASGHATVWLRLADGTPVAVERYRLDYPLELGGDPQPTTTQGEPSSAAEHFSMPVTWSDGTAYTVLTGSTLGYGFGAGTQWSGPIVWTVTPDGWFTMWTAPVEATQLISWAQAADVAFVAG